MTGIGQQVYSGAGDRSQDFIHGRQCSTNWDTASPFAILLLNSCFKTRVHSVPNWPWTSSNSPASASQYRNYTYSLRFLKSVLPTRGNWASACRNLFNKCFFELKKKSEIPKLLGHMIIWFTPQRSCLETRGRHCRGRHYRVGKNYSYALEELSLPPGFQGSS